MTPASNSGARKRAERWPEILVSIPVDLAERHLDREPGTEVAIDALIEQALADRLETGGPR